MIQNGEGIVAVAQGGTITVHIGPNDSTVNISVAGSPNTSTTVVEPNKDATLPIPQVPGGTVLLVTVGRGLRRRSILVEVIAPPP